MCVCVCELKLYVWMLRKILLLLHFSTIFLLCDEFFFAAAVVVLHVFFFCCAILCCGLEQYKCRKVAIDADVCRLNSTLSILTIYELNYNWGSFARR